ncbi:hypothetical protein LTR94_031466, partial [Friedmanniomyces endolithicus]
TVRARNGHTLIHMHGELMKARCTRSNEVVSWTGDIQAHEASPYHPSGVMRPHIVWFGEIPLEMDRIQDALSQCDLFVHLGPSILQPALSAWRAKSALGP